MNDIVITPLGTVSPYSKGNHNCPGFLLEYKIQKILLDCGSGITSLLDFPSCLDNLNVIITHYHKDHFSDIFSIQYASYVYHNLGLLNDRVGIFLPKDDIDSCKSMITSSNESYVNYFDIYDDYTFSLDDLKITCRDNHSHNIPTYMIKIQNNDYTIVYTSDIGTTNFDELIEFCRDSDLLICESSYIKLHNSSNKNHMRAYDASLLASLSNTKRLVLTHFWPEEDRNLYLEEAKEVFENTELAEENKKILLKER